MSSTLADFFATLPPSSGSPRGLSTLAKVWDCPYKAAHVHEAGVLPSAPGPQRGSEFHALWEHDVPVGLADGELTETQADAVRLYRWYKSTWGSPERRFGLRLLGVEVNADAGADLITLRTDRVYEVVQPELLVPHGVLLPTGALLLHDFKTATSTFQSSYYLCGLQARYYPAAWNHANPHAPVSGILFDEIVAHKDLRIEKTSKGGKSWNAHWAPAPLDQAARLEALRAWVRNTELLKLTGNRNESNCVDLQGNVCALYSRCYGA